MTTAIVIGGGVIGSAAALALQQRGIATRLVDPDPEWRGASRGNAGLIAINECDPLASLATLRAMPGMLFSRGGPVCLPWREIGTWLPFGLRLIAASGPARFAAGRRALGALLSEALPAWRRLTAEVAVPELLRERGHYIVWESAETARKGRSALPADPVTFHDATPDELTTIRSLVRTATQAVRFEDTAQIVDLDRLAEAMAARFAALGGARLRGRARLDGRGIRLETGEWLEADAVLVAAGPASGEVLRPLGHRVPIIAERGYHIQAAAPAWPEDMPSILFEDRSMFVTRFRTGLRATSFVEFGRAESPPDPRKWARLRRHAADVGLPFEGPVAEWMGARPTLPDYLPAIGRSTRADNVFYAFGHQHLGLTLAAMTGETIAAVVAGEPPALDLAPFDLDRFG
ncbi:FAD-binding oxidoreductase [Sphingosinicella sp. LHD-64]|uniref:NAD(P)/FAD-dependent oxidoreductase n=1 Tax=Sphingosinicella sp. LHD-64 TaxID=3072139 RepID=UPI00280CCD2A|nr:FAD-binding oxidoreductase [Sphingosinicella sp. LHD-64]MDQ8757795.1 FAD-binding oxidoreductase [Sphingosinicella sp. LHD-64]